jgi:hypothetical protein
LFLGNSGCDRKNHAFFQQRRLKAIINQEDFISVTENKYVGV